MEIDKVIARYVELRDKKAAAEAEHKEMMKVKFNDKLDALESYLLKTMNETGVDSFKTGSGTAFKSRTVSVKIADGEAFKDFVFSRPEPLFELVDIRAGKKGVQEYIERENQNVPGLDVEQRLTVNVRRA